MFVLVIMLYFHCGGRDQLIERCYQLIVQVFGGVLYLLDFSQLFLVEDLVFYMFASGMISTW